MSSKRQFCSRSVGLCLCSHVFSRTVAAVDSKCGYVGMCKGRSAQQESGAAFFIFKTIIGRAGASPPSRTTGLRCLYVYIHVYVFMYI